MFPNDDICNVKAAKSAARRIFERYKEPQQKKLQSLGLGEKEVSNLIKNAYSAININYDPSTNDVSSFMSVFGVGQSGKIDLGKIQEMAVKYLCGIDTPNQQIQVPQNNNNQISSERQTNRQQQNQTKNQSLKVQQVNGKPISLSFKNSPLNFSPSKISHNYLSPKAGESKSLFTQRENAKSLINLKYQQNMEKNSSYQQVMIKAKEIFIINRNFQVGAVTLKEAPKILQLTYQLIGKSKYSPSEQDVKIWMKLCDPEKKGLVDWANYENFVRRLLERQSIKQQH